MEIHIFDRIRTRKLTFFNDFEIELKYDAVASTFKFRFYFNPDNPEIKEMACVSHFHIVTIIHNNETLLTGQILSTAFNSSNVRQLASFGGYSLPGILEDCDIMANPRAQESILTGLQVSVNPDLPTSFQNPLAEVSPYQFDGLKLREIAQRLIRPFNLKMIIDPIVASQMEETYDETNANPSQNIRSFLSQITAQKNILLSHDEFGNLKFTRASTSLKPIAHFDGSDPTTSMSLSFNGQGMHSDLRVIQEADIDDLNAADQIVRNPYVINTVFRPRVTVMDSKSRDTLDTVQAAKNVRAQELKNVALTIDTDRWIINKKIIRPGQMISVLNPNIYLYKKSDWIIDSVHLKGSAKEYTATLNCVLPETYNGNDPTNIWAGINLH